MLEHRIHQSRPRDESARRAKILIDATYLMAEAVAFAVAIEAEVEQRRVRDGGSRLVVALRVLERSAVDVAEYHAAVDVGDAIVVAADDAVGVRHADARLAADVAL